MTLHAFDLGADGASFRVQSTDSLKIASRRVMRCESQLISVGVVVLDIMTLGREFIDIHTTHAVLL